MKHPGSASDPLWYQDAIIYELHVKAFFDGNNDGIGDFPGLLQKLDYIQDLGVTCLWLLPFFPSPQRDDGYDIADYLNVHPDYGTMEDFQTFLAAAHDRGLQVMIELVINHTSDQHPWFQRARQAAPGSPERDFYVWSDTDHKYTDARIIFTDTEHSNWTWDPVAKAYFWHRFFSHQPDLNYDNPAVVSEILTAMRFWLDLGVDGLRLDAIPYLIERDGTNCENLPETHTLIRRIRQEMDEGYAGRMILAEANQWPTDVRPYFGEGDECHMAFHFPLMPRIFMALRLEDRLPITDIMGQTPPIPPTCQWGLFLRNHDELTLEMVSDAERDYMYLAYSADPRMRVNIGIRRRLAPLMDNNRRRIELLNSLLFSFPGTPILYYGDEIGMGDNIYLGDRNGVRTPMQWNADRSGGFSRATPGRLYSPVIMDPVYGYAATNVEAQQSDASSLLHWMRNMIALRKLFRVFGRGSFEFLHPVNRKVLAYVRRLDGEQVLCVANLSRFAQPVELDLSAFDGLKPIEMIGFVDFPPITKRPYPLTLGPYGFLWFELAATHDAIGAQSQQDILRVDGGWQDMFEGGGRERFEQHVLPRFLPAQRWFGGKGRTIRAVSVLDWAPFAGARAALVLAEVQYEDGGVDTYFIPVAMTFDAAADLPPASILAPIVSTDGSGLLFDAVHDDAVCRALLTSFDEELSIASRHGRIRAVQGSGFKDTRGSTTIALPAIRGPVDQSNTSLRFGKQLILKLFRRQEPGPNPDCEIGQYLTEVRGFDRVPRFAGALEYAREGAEPATLAMLQELVHNQGDGWTWTTEDLDRYYEACSSIALPPDAEPPADRHWLDLVAGPDPAVARDHLGLMLEAAATLGRRTGQMHAALAANGDHPAFTPVPLAGGELTGLASSLRDHAAVVFDRLRSSLSTLPDDVIEPAGLALSRRRSLLDQLAEVATIGPTAGWRTRIHGDYHLAQVLRVRHDYVIIDFEGEPARSMAARRARHSPLKDVAGMVRSFSYAAWTRLLAYTTRRPEDLARLEPWAQLWERSTVVAFLRGYAEVTEGAPFLPSTPHAYRTLLDAYVVDKTLYELAYELDNRPTWVRVPLHGILRLKLRPRSRDGS